MKTKSENVGRKRPRRRFPADIVLAAVGIAGLAACVVIRQGWAAGAYLLLMNGLCFALFGIDKAIAARQSKARQSKARRIPERTLLLSAVCFGGIGGVFGMQLFHHKIRKEKAKFVLVPVVCLVQAALIFLAKRAAWL